MGYAKYREDILDAIEDNMYYKSDSYLEKVNSYSEPIIKESIEEVFKEINTRLIKLKIWIEFHNKILERFEDDMICKYVKQRNIELDRLYDKYFDKYYDKKYNHIRNKLIINENIEDTFLIKITEDFLKYLVNNFSIRRNTNNNEALNIRCFYLDLIYYLENFLNIDKDSIDKPILQYVRENILNEKNLTYHICNRCSRETYSEFKVCIWCNYDIGGK